MYHSHINKTPFSYHIRRKYPLKIRCPKCHYFNCILWVRFAADFSYKWKLGKFCHCIFLPSAHDKIMWFKSCNTCQKFNPSISLLKVQPIHFSSYISSLLIEVLVVGPPIEWPGKSLPFFLNIFPAQNHDKVKRYKNEEIKCEHLSMRLTSQCMLPQFYP